MSRVERRSLPRVDATENPLDDLSRRPFDQVKNRKIDKYRPDQARGRQELRSERTDRAAAFILELADSNNGIAPYAFELSTGIPSSLDWWCVSVLKNAGEVSLKTDSGGFVSGVRPLATMRRRYSTPASAKSPARKANHAKPRPSAGSAESVGDDIADIVADAVQDPNKATEILASVLVRIGQGAFRRKLLARWKGRCALTGCTTPELLRASHILPWRSHPKLRLNADNGLLLVAHVDAAFDAHLISFDGTGSIVLSDRLPVQDRSLFSQWKTRQLSVTPATASYLEQHLKELRRLDHVAAR